MRALVVRAPGAIGLEERDAPEPGPGEVLVRSRAMGLCRTDLEILEGELEPGWVTYPVVPGHEWAGTVAALGAGVADLAAGTEVVCEGQQPCLACARCTAGETNLCVRYRQLGFTTPGGGAELVVVPRVFVHPLAPGVDPHAAVLIEPAASVVRMLRRLALAPGETLAVVGVGTLGAAAVLLGRLAGARVTAVGVREAERALGETLGAAASAAPEDAPRGRFDAVIETAGAVPAVELALDLARRGGRIGLLGLAGEGRMFTTRADRFANDDVIVVGGASYDRAAWARTVALCNAGTLDLGRALGAQHPIDDHARAYADLAAGRTTGKTLLLHAT